MRTYTHTHTLKICWRLYTCSVRMRNEAQKRAQKACKWHANIHAQPHSQHRRHRPPNNYPSSADPLAAVGRSSARRRRRCHSKWSPGRVIECYRTLLTFLFAHQQGWKWPRFGHVVVTSTLTATHKQEKAMITARRSTTKIGTSTRTEQEKVQKKSKNYAKRIRMVGAVAKWKPRTFFGLILQHRCAGKYSRRSQHQPFVRLYAECSEWKLGIYSLQILSSLP